MLAVQETTFWGQCLVCCGNDEMLAKPGRDLAELVKQVIFPALAMMVVRHDELITGVCRVGVWLRVHNNGRVFINFMLVTQNFAKVMARMVIPVVVGLSVDLVAEGRHLASHSDFGRTALVWCGEWRGVVCWERRGRRWLH